MKPMGGPFTKLTQIGRLTKDVANIYKDFKKSSIYFL